jgi:hypothetical protein
LAFVSGPGSKIEKILQLPKGDPDVLHPLISRSADFSVNALAFNCRHQALVHICRDRILLHALEDLDSLLCGVAYHPAVRTFRDVALQFGSQLSVGFFVEVIG